MITSDVLSIQNHDTLQKVEFAQAVTELRVNYDINGCSQLTVNVADYKMRMWDNNYFQVSTPVLFKGERFRIASTEISQADGEYVNVKLEIRTEAVQKMKEDKTPQSYRSSTGFEFARKVANKFGLEPIIQEVAGVKQATIKVKEKNNKESVWDVLQRSAQDIQFMCFVADGRLFYASPQWLLGRWGLESTPGATFEVYRGKTEKRTLLYVPLIYPADPKLNYFLLQMPNMRRSEDSPKESEGTAQLWAGDRYEEGIGSAYNLRAGMTVVVYGISGFNQAYLVTSVDYQYGVSEPVEVAFATVSKLAPADKAKIDEKVSEVTVISGTGG
jgi:hypothetical protein